MRQSQDKPAAIGVFNGYCVGPKYLFLWIGNDLARKHCWFAFLLLANSQMVNVENNMEPWQETCKWSIKQPDSSINSLFAPSTSEWHDFFPNPKSI